MIQIGQDALGEWAWMLYAQYARFIESGCGYRSLESAMDAAADAFAEAKIRGELGLPSAPRFIFPDGWPD